MLISYCWPVASILIPAGCSCAQKKTGGSKNFKTGGVLSAVLRIVIFLGGGEVCARFCTKNWGDRRHCCWLSSFLHILQQLLTNVIISGLIYSKQVSYIDCYTYVPMLISVKIILLGHCIFECSLTYKNSVASISAF